MFACMGELLMGNVCYGDDNLDDIEILGNYFRNTFLDD